jgi:HD-like signal output (HDOD) protein
MPHVALKALKMCALEGTAPKDLEVVLSADPGLSAKVLKLANSPLYTMGHEIRTVGGAVQLLGLRTLRGVIFSAAYDEAISGIGGSLDKKALWAHSLATAIGARLLANSQAVDPEDAYTAGLLHQIGLVTLARIAPEVVDKLLKRCRKEARPIHEVAADVLGFLPGDLGAVVAERWSLGKHVAAAARYYWNPDLDEDTETHRTTVCVGLAHYFASQITAEPTPSIGVSVIIQKILDDLGEDGQEALRDEIRDQFHSVASMILGGLG